jgi:hypothetical protein
MAPAEAKRWMKLSADSGLWVPADSSVLEDGPERGGEVEEGEREGDIDGEYPDPA